MSFNWCDDLNVVNIVHIIVTIICLINTSSSSASASQPPSSTLSEIFCRIPSGERVPFPIYSLETCGLCYYYMPNESFIGHSHDGTTIPGKFKYRRWGVFDDLSGNRVLSNETAILSSTFLSSHMSDKWQRCCQDAVDCCLGHLSRLELSTERATSSNLRASLMTLDELSERKDRNPNEGGPHPETSTLNPLSENEDFTTTNDRTFLFSSQPLSSESGKSCPRTWDGWTCWPDDVPRGVTVQQTCPDHIYWKITAPPCRGKSRCRKQWDNEFLG